MNLDDTENTGGNTLNFYAPGGSGVENQIKFFNGAGRPGGANSIIKATDIGGGLSKLSFWTAPTDNSTSAVERITIAPSGDFGIKNSDP